VSPGLIYPVLQQLEDMGYVSSEDKEGKKIYSIMSEGRKHLEENAEVVERLRAGKAYAEKIGRFSFLNDLRDLESMVLVNGEEIDDGKADRIREVIVDARKRTASIIFE
jgi:DNA-binding PadR family transcriptional regulator